MLQFAISPEVRPLVAEKRLQNRERTGSPAGQPGWGGGSDRIQVLNRVLQVLRPAKVSIAECAKVHLSFCFVLGALGVSAANFYAGGRVSA
jgi:hypothetical protein